MDLNFKCKTMSSPTAIALGAALTADSDADDDDNENNEEELGSNSSDDEEDNGDEELLPKDDTAAIEARALLDDLDDDTLIMTYGKKSFVVSDEAIVMRGKPFEFESGEQMGKMLASKSPDEWRGVKTKHITVLNNGTHDFLYISGYVAGSDAQVIDQKRLHSVSKVVSKALITRFQNSTMSDQRKQAIDRLLSFEPPPDAAGPQINPLIVGWRLLGIETSKVPTVIVKPVTRPRPPAHKKQSKKQKKLEEEAQCAAEGGFSGSVASMASTANTNNVNGHIHETPDVDIRSVKRLRTLEVYDPGRTHIFIGANNKVYCVEY